MISRAQQVKSPSPPQGKRSLSDFRRQAVQREAPEGWETLVLQASNSERMLRYIALTKIQYDQDHCIGGKPAMVLSTVSFAL